MKLLREKYLPLVDEGYLSFIDLHCADAVMTLEGGVKEPLYKAVLALSRSAREKHVCISLDAAFGGELPGGSAFNELIAQPDACVWEKELFGCRTVGKPGDYRPLILDGNRLYMHKYFYFETLLASQLIDASQLMPDSVLPADLVDALFPASGSGVDWQKCAAVNAVIRRFSAVTGGPGTGKTTTAAKILILCAELYRRNGESCRIALCAPTGKAAAHLHGSIRSAVNKLNEVPAQKKLAEEAMKNIPEKSYTIHRLLGYAGELEGFRHNAENPLPYDVIIADEMSMADISLSAKLVDAVGPSCRLIFLGDRDQLSSVEAGSVMGDICGVGDEKPYPADVAEIMKQAGIVIPAEYISDKTGGIRGAVVYLKESRRFSADSGIGKAAVMINASRCEQDAEKSYAAIASGACREVSWAAYPHAYSPQGFISDSRLQAMLADVAGIDSGMSPYRGYASLTDAEEFLSRMKEFQILCALRRGPFGVNAVNAALPRLLRERGLLKTEGMIYHGMPVIITENSYPLRLFNGDIGIAVTHNGVLRVAFPDAEKGSLRYVNPHQLPSWDSAWALTVHKSQGSEYGRVCIILPPDDMPVVTRELIYTALTRARESAVIAGKKESFVQACARGVQRSSGLRKRLY